MEFTSYALPPLASAVAGLVLAAIALRHRAVAGGVPFIALMIGLIEWSVGYALELLAVDPEVKFFWHRLMYFGVVAVPVCVLVFALAYAGKDAWLRPRTFVLLAIEPVVVVLLAWTNSAHGLMWPTHPVRAAQGVILLDVTFGPAYQFNVAYSYVLVVGAVAVLAQTLRRGGRLYGQQVFALLVAILAPLAANV
jgi:hypothetical protein